MDSIVKKVIKRDGRIVDFDPKRIEIAIKKAMLATNVYDEKKLYEIVKYVIKLIEEKFDEKKIPHVEEIQDIVEYALMKFDLYNTAKAYVLYRKEREKIREEKKKILNKDAIDEVDKKFSLNSLRVIASRYLLRDEKGNIIESPKQMFQRVAMAIVIPDILHDKEVFDKEGKQKTKEFEVFEPKKWEGKIGLGKKDDGYEAVWNKYHLERMKDLYDRLNSQGKMKLKWSEFFDLLVEGKFEKYYQNFLEYYNLMVEKRFCPNSPTLFNAGARLGQLSACFVLSIDDSIDSIMETSKEAAIVFKSGGGVGINYSKLRPEGDIVASTSGVASGPISFMKIIDTVTEVIKQGGKRRGANIGILEIWHPDIERFITCKVKEGELTNFNISVMITPEFWDAYEKGKEYPLINPRTNKVVRAVDPKNLLNMIAFYAWKTADPGVLFFDNINRRNILMKARGPIRATNPCVTGNTLISTEFGLMRMEDLVKKYPDGGIRIGVDNRVPIEIKYPNGLSMIVQKGQQGISFYEITRAFCTGVKDVYKIETESGYELEATADHKVLTTEGWVEIKDIVPGKHFVLIQSGEGEFSKTLDLPFKVKNKIKGKNGRIYEFNLPNKWSKELGQVVGWLVGDGWIRKGKEPRVGFVFSDKKLMEYFKKILNKWYGKNIKEVKRKNNVYHLSYHSKYFVKFFEKLGVKIVKAEEKEVPISIFTAPKEAVIGFLQGLFSADGTIGIHEPTGNYYIRLMSKSKKLLKQVQMILLNLGIKSKIYNRTRKLRRGFSYVSKSGKVRTYLLDGVLFELNITRKNILAFLNKVGFLNKKNIEKIKLLKQINYKEFAFEERVVKKEFVGKKKVYDLTEPISKTFLTNGFISLDCGEQPLHPYGSCNLGSINLYAFVKREGNKTFFDWEGLEKTIKKAINFLDNVIDINKYPLEKIAKVSRESRNIGLGFMGLADTLFALKIPYNSEEGFEFMRRVTEFIAYHAFLQSIERSKERGSFPIFEKSGYVDGDLPVEGFYRKDVWTTDWSKIPELIKKFGIRNSNLISIAPTGSISMIMDTSSGLEPQFALTFEKIVTVGKFYYVDPEFEIQLKERGLYNEEILKKIADNGGSVQGIEEIPEDMKKVFVVAYDVPWWDHVRAQYEIGLWVDAGISKTINMPNWVVIEDVLDAYIFAHKLGLKGITIYRDGSKSVQVLVTPTQKKGKYMLKTKNKTFEMMENFGINTKRLKEAFSNNGSLVKNNGIFLNVRNIPKNIDPQEIQDIIKGEEIETKNNKKSCPICKSKRLLYHEGCVTCLDCGWSECIIS